jgi:PTS system N-acetylglucosamine-specific IIC component
MVLSSRNPLATHWWMLIPQGLVFFVIYYVVFRFTITKFNLMTRVVNWLLPVAKRMVRM